MGHMWSSLQITAAILAVFTQQALGNMNWLRRASFQPDHIMQDGSGGAWNGEHIPFRVAEGILGWNLPQDVVGAGVYGGIAKRDPQTGGLVLGFEWPENNGNWDEGPHCQVAPHAGMKSPHIDFSKFSVHNRGYTTIANMVTAGDTAGLRALFDSLGTDKDKRRRLANVVMAGGARPLHMAGMTRGGNPQAVVHLLLQEGADPNAFDCYAMTPLDRMQSNGVVSQTLRAAGGHQGTVKTSDVPDWSSEEFAYQGGIGEFMSGEL